MAEPKHCSSFFHGGKTREQCEAMIQKTLQTRKVKLLMENMEKAGCPVGRNFFKAVMCKGNTIGYFHRRGGGIFVCHNHVKTQEDVTVTITHELIHAFDECRAANMNWTNCAHLACSEIRANHLSGDCYYKRELLKHLSAGRYMKMRGHEPECIKRRVLQSLAVNPYCTNTTGKDAMEYVWDICYNDTQPYERAP